MSYNDDRKNRKKGELPTYSSLDRFKQDAIGKEEKTRAKNEARKKRNKMQREQLRKGIEEAKGKSAPEKEEKKDVIQAHERDESAKDVAEKINEREEKRKAATEQGGPESGSQLSG